MKFGGLLVNLSGFCVGMVFFCLAPARAGETVVLEQFETAGIDGRFDQWDAPSPGALAADAVHRSLLLRFQNSAEVVANRLREGRIIEKAEIVFEFDRVELESGDLQIVAGARIQENPPHWHYVAWALRRPWSAAEGMPHPTFNAWMDGAGYWAKYGAQDETTDRHPARFGPTEVSVHQPESRMDVTAILTDPAHGATAGERLRAFEEQGVLIRKWEAWDVRLNHPGDYEWFGSAGGNAIAIASARLELTLANGTTAGLELPPARDLAALAEKLAADGSGGAPTTVMPSDDEIKTMAERVAPRKPDWMPDWQWERVRELRRIGGGSEYADAFESGDPEQYRRQIRNLLIFPPRFWIGWSIQDQLLLWYQYGDQLPPYAQDHVRDYWASQTAPDLSNEEIANGRRDRARAGDDLEMAWRGWGAFFRQRFTQHVSTMAFNHMAIMGALLGGEIVGSPFAIEDGRTGLEKLPLRFWAFLDGTSQEMLDQYYYSISISTQKMFADYGPTPLDRLMGEMIRDRAVELLASGYHPHLRRFVGAGGRTRMSNVLGFEQEGIHSLMHTLSPAGVLFHIDRDHNAVQEGMHLFGYDFPPGRVALQTRASPWAPEWAVGIVDTKPIPYEETSAESTRDHFRNPPLWRRSYLGATYGLASQDIKGGTVDVMAQWKGSPGAATDATQLGTLTVRYNINAPRVARTGGGGMPYSGGIVTFQHKNRAIVCAKPRTERESTERFAREAGDDGVRSLYSTVALWNFRDSAGWTLYIDGREQTDFPVTLQAGQRITIRDGSSYVAIIPLPVTALGMGEVVMIEPGIPESLGDRTPNTSIAPMLMVNSYNVKLDAPLAEDDPRWEAICHEAYGGFVLELGDEAEYGDFAAFQRHIAEAKLEAPWNATERRLDIVWDSGDQRMEMGFSPDFPQADVHFAVEPGQHIKAIPYRRVNGGEPYLPSGIERDTTLTRQGSTGRLEKNGAVLAMEPGRMGYLQTVPLNGVYVGYNPFPDLSNWSLTVPGGMEIRADGKLGLARVAVQSAANVIHIDYAFKEEQMEASGRARRLLVLGASTAPTVFVNSEAAAAEAVTVDGTAAFAIALR